MAPFECSCAHDKVVSLVAPGIQLLGLSVGDLGLSEAVDSRPEAVTNFQGPTK